MQAAEQGYATTVEALARDHDTEKNSQDFDNNTALMLAIIAEQTQSARVLASNPDVNVNNQNKAGDTALILAVKHNNPRIVATLLNLPRTQVNTKNQAEMSALLLAVKRNNLGITDQLIHVAKTNINQSGTNGSTALHVAIQEGFSDVTKLLLNHPYININLGDNNGDTPLMLAIKLGDQDLATLLIQHNMLNLKTTNNAGDTLFDILAKFPSREIKTSLISQYAGHAMQAIDAAEHKKKTADQQQAARDLRFYPLHAAVASGKPPLVRKALGQQSPNKNGPNRKRLTLSRVNAFGPNGETALHTAIRKGCPTTVEALLDAGANTHKPNHQGLTPSDLAQRSPSVEIQTMMQRHEATSPTVRPPTLRAGTSVFSSGQTGSDQGQVATPIARRLGGGGAGIT